MSEESRDIPDGEERRRINEELDINILVEAAAGTGKTTSMVNRMVALIRRGKCEVGTIAAVTFTRKAAAELRSRFQVALEQAARDAVEHGLATDEAARLQSAVNQIERCFVGTIHAFCARLLRERPIEAGVDLAFREIEEHADALLRTQAWNEYVAALHATDDDILRELDELGITGFLTQRDEVLEELEELGLDIAQLESMFNSYVQYPDVEDWPTQDVPMPDLRPVMQEMREYADHMQAVEAIGFPSDRGNDKLMEFFERAPRLIRQVKPDRVADVMNLLARFHGSVGAVQKMWPVVSGEKIGKRESDRLKSFRERTKPLLTTWLECRYATIFRVLRPAKDVYDGIRTRAGVLNFQDLLMKAAELLRSNPSVREYFRARFTHLLVDEFQDTDPIQAEVMLLLTADDPHETQWKNCRPLPGSLFVVGDPKQSIYRFRRADIVTFNTVKDIMSRVSTPDDADSRVRNGDVIPLWTNFRSSKSVIGWINRVFAKVFPSKATRYSPSYHALEVGRHEEIDGDLTGVCTIKLPSGCSDSTAIELESSFVARAIRQALDEHQTIPRTQRQFDENEPHEAQARDFLILVHNKKYLTTFAETLEALGIPHEMSGAKAMDWLTEIQLLTHWLEAIYEPENSIALVAVLRGDLCGFSDPELYAFRKSGGRYDFRGTVPEGLASESAKRFEQAFRRLKSHADWLRRLPLFGAIERIVADLGLAARALTEESGQLRAGGLGKVVESLREAREQLHSLSDILGFLQNLQATDGEFDVSPAGPRNPNAVRLMNLHKAKGLEAPIVFLAGTAGAYLHPPTLHIDRTGDRPRGFAVVHGKKTDYGSPPLLAQPPDWERFKDEEKQFEQAEANRLMYVAATRAGSRLVIVDRESGGTKNPWRFFSKHFAGCSALEDPGVRQRPETASSSFSMDDYDRAADGIRQSWKTILTPSFVVASAKEIALSEKIRPEVDADGGLGSAWGAAIHRLLEAAVRNPTIDLLPLAVSTLSESRTTLLGREHDAIAIVKSVMASDIWRRSQTGSRCMSEVPFEYRQDAEPETDGKPMLIRGIIDLIFKEANGWVIVDFKTDACSAANVSKLAEYYRDQLLMYADAWSAMTGEPVAETGMFFTAVNQYVS
ncbi:MAG: UvrD-helicase domain-containing protein [Planctomycetota bacterium]|nr:UvrD-helicase domain-containing protein [Planctomycetota bacterium]